MNDAADEKRWFELLGEFRGRTLGQLETHTTLLADHTSQLAKIHTELANLDRDVKVDIGLLKKDVAQIAKEEAQKKALKISLLIAVITFVLNLLVHWGPKFFFQTQ